MEFIVMIGLVFVGITAIYFTYQALNYAPDSAPIGISEEEMVLREPIDDLMKNAAETALRGMEYQGGYSLYGVTGGDQLEMIRTKIFTNPIIPPAVPPDRALIRTSYTATHTDAQMDRVLEVFERVGRKLGVLGRPVELQDT